MSTSLFEALFRVDTTELDKGTEKVKKMGEATKKTSEANEHLEKVINGVGGVVAEAAEQMNKFKESIHNLTKGFESLSNIQVSSISKLGEFGSAMLSVAGMATVLAAALGTVGVLMAFEAYEHIEDMGDLAEMYGYSATQINLMTDAAQKAGSSLQAVEASYAKVAKAAYNANDPLQGTGSAFKTLGVNVKDANGDLKSAQELTGEAIKSWEEGKKTTADFAAMTAVLGKGWEQNLPAIKAVAEANEVANEQAKKGIGISKESAEIVEKHTKANIEMRGIMTDVGSRLVEIVIPAFTNLTKWLIKSYEDGGMVAGVFKAIEGGAWLLTGAIRALIGVFEIVDVAVTIVGKGLGALGASVAALLNRDFSGAANVWKEYFSDVGHHASELSKSLKELGQQQMDSLNGPRTIEGNKGGNASGGGGDTKPVEIKKAIGEANDMYDKYLRTIEKASEAQQHFTELQKADIEIKRLDIEYEKQRAEIAAHNAEVMKKGGQLKEQLDPKKREEEIARIRQQAAALDELRSKQMVEGQMYNRLDEMVTRYNEAIDKNITANKKDALTIQDETAKKAILIERDKQLLELANSQYNTAKNREAINRKANEDLDKITEATNRAREAQNDWLGNGIDNYLKNLGTLNQGLTKITTEGIGRFSDAITNLVLTGKGGVREMVASILQDLARMLMQMAIMAPMIAALRSMMGLPPAPMAAMPSLPAMSGGGMPIAAAADGAEFGDLGNFGKSIVVGEKGPERVVPKANTAIIPSNQMQSSSSGTVNIVNNINITSSGDNSKPEDQQKLARAIVTMIDQRFNDNMAKANRPGGVNNRVSMKIG